MNRHHLRRAPALLLALGLAAPLSAQRLAVRTDTGGVNVSADQPRGLVTREELIVDRLRNMGIDSPDPAPRKPKDHADSLAWNRHRRAADAIEGRKIVVSIYDRRLWLIDENGDTLIDTRAGVGMGAVTAPSGRVYDFSTPRGLRRVLLKEEEPLWNQPDWHFYSLGQRVM